MKRLILILAALCAAAVLAGAGYLGWRVWQRFNVPVYSFAQAPAPDGLFTNSFLSGSGIRYVKTRPEYSLELIDSRFGYTLIGRTDNDQDVRAVPGNPDYISLTGFMNPVDIFRKESAPPVDLATLPISEIHYLANYGTLQAPKYVRKSTADAQIIAEVVHSMQSAPIDLPQTEQVYHIEILSPELPGLVYSIYVEFDSSGAVSLAPLYDSQHGVPAGPLFTEWVKK